MTVDYRKRYSLDYETWLSIYRFGIITFLPVFSHFLLDTFLPFDGHGARFWTTFTQITCQFFTIDVKDWGLDLWELVKVTLGDALNRLYRVTQ